MKIFCFMAGSVYHIMRKEVENCFKHNHTFTYACVSNPSWKSSGTIILYSYLRFLDRLLNVFFLVFHCNTITASWKTKNEKLSYRKRYTDGSEWEISLFVCVSSFLSHLLLFFIYSLSFVYSNVMQKKILFWFRKWCGELDLALTY